MMASPKRGSPDGDKSQILSSRVSDLDIKFNVGGPVALKD
jgi:hypothetical protein